MFKLSGTPYNFETIDTPLDIIFFDSPIYFVGFQIIGQIEARVVINVETITVFLGYNIAAEKCFQTVGKTGTVRCVFCKNPDEPLLGGYLLKLVPFICTSDEVELIFQIAAIGKEFAHNNAGASADSGDDVFMKSHVSLLCFCLVLERGISVISVLVLYQHGNEDTRNWQFAGDPGFLIPIHRAHREWLPQKILECLL